ncbi:MAG: TRAFs-binding domain-containing protein [Myxococcota bacterium]
MPFGSKSRPGRGPDEDERGPSVIEFDDVYQALFAGADAAGCEVRRADIEPGQGFVHRSMYEALLLSEFAVVDMTFANVNVAYELGVRHGAHRGATVMVCEKDWIPKLGFDFRPFRVIPYEVSGSGRLGDGRSALVEALKTQLKKAMAGELPPDNPILQVTDVFRAGAGHEKTDIFLQRLAYAGEMSQRVAACLRQPDPRALAGLRELRDEVLANESVVEQLHSALMALYLGFRERKGYTDMAALYERLPRELAATPVAREQLGLALNRLAEAAAKDGRADEASELRQRAIGALEQLERSEWTSETFGILGRIYKGRYDAEQKAGRPEHARAALDRSVEAYESGFRDDPRDYYPGVNVVTLRILRGTPGDEAALAELVPVVRFAVDRAPTPDKPEERYWQTATQLELACAGRDFDAAREHARELLGLDVPPWMYETTAKNLLLQRDARSDEAETVAALDEIVSLLQSP